MINKLVLPLYHSGQYSLLGVLDTKGYVYMCFLGEIWLITNTGNVPCSGQYFLVKL